MIAAPSPTRCMGLRGIRDNAPVKLTCAFTHCRTLSSGSSSRVRQKLKRRQAAFEFLVGTQGLEPWTQ